LKLLEDINCDSPDLVCEECRELLEQIASNTKLINAKTNLIKQLAKESGYGASAFKHSLASGPLTAMAIDAFAPSMEHFKNGGGGLSAWLGPVPRQYSSGGKERLGRRLYKGWTGHIRRLLIIGASVSP